MSVSSTTNDHVVSDVESLSRLGSNDHDAKPLPPLPGRPETKKSFFPLHDRQFSSGWLKILLRSLRLQIFTTPRHKSKAEHPKVAIHKSRRKAFIRTSIHVLPVFGCICLIVLNWRSTYILWDSAWLASLAFVSKLHEILMQASIGAILATWIRRELLHNRGLPLGGLFAIVQAANPAYLWSLEFWGSLSPVKLGNIRTWRPLGFAAIVIVSILLASSVGPASNIAMLPRYGRFLLGTSIIRFEDPENTIFPPVLDHQDITHNACEEGIYCNPTDYNATHNAGEVLKTNWLASQTEASTELGGAAVWRQLKVFTQNSGIADLGAGNEPWEGAYVATTSQAGISGALYKTVESFLIWTKRGLLQFKEIRAEHSIETRAPFVASVCATTVLPAPNGINNDSNVDATEINFRDFADGIFSSNRTIGDVRALIKPGKVGQVLWLNPPSEHRRNISVTGLIISAQKISACSIKAVWGGATINITSDGSVGFTSRPIVQLPPTTPPWNTGNWTEDVISITPRWMQQILPSDIDKNDNRNDTLSMPSLSDYVPQILGLDGMQASQSRVEVYLSGLIAAGMSRIKNFDDMPNRTMHYWFMKEECKVAKPWHNTVVQVGHCGSLPELPDGHTEIRLRAYLVGRGYSFDDTPTYLATAILMLYGTLAFLHIMYTVWTGTSSNSWDSVAEITVLALNSTPPHSLQHTSAGVENMRTFSHPVGIRVRNRENLELVFVGDGDESSDELTRLMKNRKY